MQRTIWIYAIALLAMSSFTVGACGNEEDNGDGPGPAEGKGEVFNDPNNNAPLSLCELRRGQCIQKRLKDVLFSSESLCNPNYVESEALGCTVDSFAGLGAPEIWVPVCCLPENTEETECESPEKGGYCATESTDFGIYPSVEVCREGYERNLTGALGCTVTKPGPVVPVCCLPNNDAQ